MSTETPVPDLPRLNVFITSKKDSTETIIVMSTETSGAWGAKHPEYQVFGHRAMNILGDLPPEDQKTFLQICKVPAVARALESITNAFSAVATRTLRAELEASDTRLKGKLALDMMLKMFGPDVISLLVKEYSAVYPVTGERSGVALEQAATSIPPAATAAANEAPPAEEVRVLRPGVAETVSEGEEVRTEGGQKLRVDENFS